MYRVFRNRGLAALALAAMVAAFGCGGGPSIEGRWEGSGTNELTGNEISFTMTLERDGDQVTGTGTYTQGDQQLSLTDLSGQIDEEGEFDIAYQSPGGQQLIFDGALSGDGSMSGEIEGSQTRSEPVESTATRQ